MLRLYCSSILNIGLPLKMIQKPKQVKNAVAHLLVEVSHSAHIIPVLNGIALADHVGLGQTEFAPYDL